MNRWVLGRTELLALYPALPLGPLTLFGPSRGHGEAQPHPNAGQRTLLLDQSPQGTFREAKGPLGATIVARMVCVWAINHAGSLKKWSSEVSHKCETEDCQRQEGIVCGAAAHKGLCECPPESVQPIPVKFGEIRGGPEEEHWPLEFEKKGRFFSKNRFYPQKRSKNPIFWTYVPQGPHPPRGPYVVISCYPPTIRP